MHMKYARKTVLKPTASTTLCLQCQMHGLSSGAQNDLGSHRFNPFLKRMQYPVVKTVFVAQI